MMRLTDFTDATPDLAWRVVDDAVMGGRSRGRLRLEPGRLRFTGETVTDGGGFSSVRSGVLPPVPAGTRAFRLTVRGDERGWYLRAEDAAGNAWWAELPPVSPGREAVVEVPVAAFRPRFRGRWLPGGPPEPSAIRGLGLIVTDGRDGPFDLEVRLVEACTDPDPALPTRPRPA